jgi:hypothetical protein
VVGDHDDTTRPNLRVLKQTKAGGVGT